MTDWVQSLEGTEAGHQAALALALTAAFLHAVFGALQKGRFDPWLTRGAIDFWLLLLALPMAVFLVPRPEGFAWAILFGALVIHFVYKVGMALAFERGAFTVVYPVVRGTGPLFTVIGAWLIFGETFTGVQWLGVCVLLVGIFGLAVYNLVHIRLGRDTLVPALALAVATGAMVAVYTTYDAFGIRYTPDPFTFLAWFFVITSLDFPIIAFLRWRNMVERPAARPLLAR
ncbi:MAG: EamA family transporter, partial [Arenibacterium sp.]